LNNLSIMNEALIASATALQSSNDTRQPIFGAGLFVVGTCLWSGPMKLDTNLFVFGESGTEMNLYGTITGSGGMLLSLDTVNLNGSPNTYTGETFVTGT